MRKDTDWLRGHLILLGPLVPDFRGSSHILTHAALVRTLRRMFLPPLCQTITRTLTVTYADTENSSQCPSDT
jgi:hypothetical protein